MDFIFEWQEQYLISAVNECELLLPPEHKIHIFELACITKFSTSDAFRVL